MGQSLLECNLHLVFSTKNRQPLITSEIEPELYAYMKYVLAEECRSPARKIDGVEDHVHILLRLSRTWTVSDVIKTIKAKSSKWIKSKGPGFRDFYWQTGYGGFSVSRSHLISVEDYIAAQKEHHRKKTYQDEFRALLRAHEIEFDERYVWD